MKRLYLTSNIDQVIDKIIEDLKPTKGNNRLVYIKTAAEDMVHDGDWMDINKKCLENVGFEVTDYTIKDKKEEELRQDFKNFDAIYVEGGNTFFLLEKAQQSGFIKVIREQVLNEGKPYIGTSAGSVIAGPDIYPVLRLDDKSLAPNLKGYEGFGLVDFVVLPHWGSEMFKDLYLKQRLEHAYPGKTKLILLRDNQFVEVKDDWYRIVEG